MPRTFIGWPLPEELRLRIEATTARLREELPRASWTSPRTYHLTFAFLGEQSEETIRAVGDELVSKLARVVPAPATIGKPGFFPSARRPRVGWLGLSGSAELERIVGTVRGVLTALQVEFDAKPFRPHLTLARPKARWGREETDRFLSALDPLAGVPILVDSVTLFESRLGSGGARHVSRVVAACAPQ